MMTLAAARPDLVVRGRPVRGFSWYAGMRHYPGWWWSSTRGDLVGYESLLERDRLMLADFDRDVVAIASQPFGITGQVGGSVRRHALGCRGDRRPRVPGHRKIRTGDVRG